MKQKYDAVQEFFKEVMVKDEDFGVIPGTQKPSLYKPGAEKLCELYGFAAIVKEKIEERSFETGFYRVSFTLQMIHRSSGVIIGEGVGECSTNESKYMYRWVSENKIPRLLNKDELLFEEKEGQYGAYKSFRIPNEDLYSQWNTILKMAYKRAYVGLTLQCTRSSGIFTQDEAEMDDYADVAPEDRKQQRGGRAANANSGRYQGGGQKSGGTSGGSRSAGGQSGGSAQKNRVLALMKQQELDWNSLADTASIALGRQIKKVISDIQTEADWKIVGDFLEMEASTQQDGGFDPADLPEDL
ncbi:hypothetical protein J4772_11285 [Cohnella sp. LGH]|uniref:hypothetical protein n=1 Tax=Cohnella sp. LGH TaxID=1619153 RepID=UPI001AD9ACAD|nr:hypothetical protein [Cohnella sp. LGH]QTH44924.1 hypothetical protein J4772_11285 [Cohnella sp. LGH]